MSSQASGPRRKGRKKIPDSQQRLVWVRSGGRCAICNKYLLEGGMTYREVSLGELAHIIGQQATAGSPRGLESRASARRNDADNLMLVCGDDHQEVDDPAALDLFTIQRLTALRRRHEDRIHHVTGLADDRSTTVIRMLAPVRGKEVELSRETAATTVIRSADRFPRFLESYHRHGIEIDVRHLPGESDAGPDYYRNATTLIDKLIARLNEGISHDEVVHLSVFAFARIPLLVYLGSRLDDTIPTDIYQRHRISESWDWTDDGPSTEFTINSAGPDTDPNQAVLILNVSGTIQHAEVPHDLGGLRVHTLAPTNTQPEPNTLRNRNSLRLFEGTIRRFLSALEANAKTVRQLHVLPAIPISAAVTLGRTRDPQVHPELLIYDRTATGYRLAATIT